MIFPVLTLGTVRTLRLFGHRRDQHSPGLSITREESRSYGPCPRWTLASSTPTSCAYASSEIRFTATRSGGNCCTAGDSAHDSRAVRQLAKAAAGDRHQIREAGCRSAWIRPAAMASPYSSRASSRESTNTRSDAASRRRSPAIRAPYHLTCAAPQWYR